LHPYKERLWLSKPSSGIPIVRLWLALKGNIWFGRLAKGGDQILEEASLGKWKLRKIDFTIPVSGILSL
jgi:hypothetical protein